MLSPQGYNLVEGSIQALKDANVMLIFPVLVTCVMLTPRGGEGKMRLQLEESIQRRVQRYMLENTLVIWETGEEAAVGLQ